MFNNHKKGYKKDALVWCTIVRMCQFFFVLCIYIIPTSLFQFCGNIITSDLQQQNKKKLLITITIAIVIKNNNKNTGMRDE